MWKIYSGSMWKSILCKEGQTTSDNFQIDGGQKDEIMSLQLFLNVFIWILSPSLLKVQRIMQGT